MERKVNYPNRQHYLPKFYLKGFANTGTLSVYDRSNQEFRQQSPKTTGLRKHFYTYIDDENNLNTNIEAGLALIEGEAGTVIRKLEQRQQIDVSEFELIAVFAVLFLTRVPEFDKMHRRIMDVVQRDLVRFMFADKERAQVALDAFPDESPNDGLTAQDMVDFVQRDEYQISTPRESTLSVMGPLSLDIARLMMEMEWRILHTSPDTGFITSDNPFTMVAADEGEPSQPRRLGIAVQGVRKIVPLSPSVTS